MSIHIGKVKGNIQNNEQGSGIQINTVLAGNKDDVSSGIAAQFAVKYGSDCTLEEKEAVIEILNELDRQVIESPLEVKEKGAEPWWKKIQVALNAVASLATISKASWWTGLGGMVTEFIDNIKV